MTQNETIAALDIFNRLEDPKQAASDETRYFISSRQLDVEDFAKAARSRWGKENKPHWILDIFFRDDENRARIRNAAANFVTLKHITLNLLKMAPAKKSMRVKRKWAGWDAGFLLSVLQASIGEWPSCDCPGGFIERRK